MNILFLGYNSFKQFKRGVENVIDFQSKAYPFKQVYYLYWGKLDDKVSKYNNIICIPVKHVWHWPIMLNLITYKLIKRGKLFIHSHNPLFSVFLLKQTNLFTVHDGLYYLSKSSKKQFKYIFFILEKVLYKRCRFVHFISEFTKKNSLYGNQKNFETIPNTSHLEPRAPIIQYQISNDRPYRVLIVKSIEERARFDLLINVAELIRNEEITFIVAGKGPLWEYFNNIIIQKKLTNIRLLGFVEETELISLYKQCDLVLMIAEYGEGFGLPIIEGYLFNKPVIASNKCAIPEVIKDSIFLFENNTNAITEKLHFAKNNGLQNFREYYDKEFSNAFILKRYELLYKKLI